VLAADDKLSQKGAWSGNVNHLNFGRHQPHPENGGNDQSLYTDRLCQVPANGWQVTLKVTLKRSVVRVTWAILNFMAPMISLKRLKLQSSNFTNR